MGEGDGRVVVRYSEAFKRRVVMELESGRCASVGAAQRRYGIRGSMTIGRWVRRLGKNHLLARVVRVETVDERREVERLRAQVRALEHALAQTRMQQLVAEAQFEVVCREQGLDAEAQKKKADVTRSGLPGVGRKARGKKAKKP